MEEYKAANGEEIPGRFGQGKACWVQQHKEEGWGGRRGGRFLYLTRFLPLTPAGTVGEQT